MALLKDLIEKKIMEPVGDAYPVFVLTYKTEEIAGLRRGQKRDFNKIYNKELQADAGEWDYYRISDLKLEDDDKLAAEEFAEPIFVPAVSVPYISDLDEPTKKLLTAGVRIAQTEGVAHYLSEIDDLKLAEATDLDQAFTDFEAAIPALKNAYQQLLDENKAALEKAKQDEEKSQSNDSSEVEESKPTSEVSQESVTSAKDHSPEHAMESESSGQQATSAVSSATRQTDDEQTASQAVRPTVEEIALKKIEEPEVQKQLRQEIAKLFEVHAINDDISVLNYELSDQTPELNLLASNAERQIHQVVNDGNELLTANQLQTSKMVYQRVSQILSNNLKQIKQQTEFEPNADNQFGEQLKLLEEEKASAFKQADADIQNFNENAKHTFDSEREKAGEAAKNAALAKFDQDHSDDVDKKTVEFKTKLESKITDQFSAAKAKLAQDVNEYRTDALSNVVQLSLYAPTEHTEESLETISKTYEDQANKVIKASQQNIQKISDDFNEQTQNVLAKLAKSRAKAQAKKLQRSEEEAPVTKKDLYKVLRDSKSNVAPETKIKVTNPVAGSVPGYTSNEDNTEEAPRKRETKSPKFKTWIAGAAVTVSLIGGGVLGSALTSHNSTQSTSSVRADSSSIAKNTSESNSSAHVFSDASSTDSSSSESGRNSYLNNLKIGDAVTIRPNNKNITAKVTSLNSDNVTVETSNGDQYSIKK